MRLIRIICGFLVLLSCALASTLAGSQTSRPEILPGFKNKILILRGFYRDDNLHFRQDGQLVGPAESGFGPTDGTVHVAMVLLEPSKIVVIGDLPLLYYDAETEALHYSEGPIRRKIQIDLDDPQGAENALWKVFFRPGESPLPACSDAQRLDYQKRQLALLQSGEQPKGVPYPADGLCLPMGEKIVNRVGKDVTTPKSISTPDPIFPEDGPRGPFNGSVLLGMVIDSTGRPSTITILRGLGESLDHASVAKVLGWKFDPAMRDGKPVPVYVTAEIKFRRQ